MQVEHLSSDYQVSLLSKKDVPKIYQLYQGNPLYFEHMKTQPTLENTKEDLIVLPPGKQKQDKFFVGFWEKEKLIADINTAVSKSINKMMFGLRDQVSRQTLRECVEGLEKVYEE